ncbi:DUF3119 family protein [Oscillatoria sp. CS-180]|uniref:DUF3119 family protein n=1 Tax=Oscillatoria sp. CS-180 TaxID=3021720 RepID=UPI00232B1F84|nr:DUF3119 family protein [Oscillatoria sp. CS-180]MDB9528995.1 DUF3119 family protein [Oscillatoria sp. CS-180]
MTSSSTTASVTLQPSYNIPIALILGGLGWASLAVVMFGKTQLVLACVVLLFGLFLLYQAMTLRVVFTETDLDIYRGDNRIRRFPYQDWEIWDIFWSPVPTLFYFREINSIHFLPILFRPEELRSQLEQRLPTKAAVH